MKKIALLTMVLHTFTSAGPFYTFEKKHIPQTIMVEKIKILNEVPDKFGTFKKDRADIYQRRANYTVSWSAFEAYCEAAGGEPKRNFQKTYVEHICKGEIISLVPKKVEKTSDCPDKSYTLVRYKSTGTTKISKTFCKNPNFETMEPLKLNLMEFTKASEGWEDQDKAWLAKALEYLKRTKKMPTAQVAIKEMYDKASTFESWVIKKVYNDTRESYFQEPEHIVKGELESQKKLLRQTSSSSDEYNVIRTKIKALTETMYTFINTQGNK